MRHLLIIVRFGKPYLGRYWRRFVMGVLLAFIFAVTNGLVVGYIKTLMDRMSPPTPTQTAPVVETANAVQGPASTEGAKTWFKEEGEKFKAALQPTINALKDLGARLLPKAGESPGALQIAGILLLLPLLAAIRGFSGYLSSYCLAWVSERVVNDLRVDVLDKLSSLSLDFFNRSTMGDLLTRVSGDTAALQRCLSLGFSDLIKEPLTVLSVVVCLGFIEPRLTLIALVFFPLVVYPVLFFGRKVRKAATAGLKTTITQSSLLVEILSGIRVVKAFSLEQQQLDRFRKLSRELIHSTMRGVRARELINPFIEVLSTLGFGVILLYILCRHIQVSDMVAVLFGVAFIYTPIKKLAYIHVLLQQTDAAVNRLMAIMREQPTVHEASPAVPLPPIKSGITFENLGFSYGQKPVLQDINLAVPRGEKLGVAGESGSGKSTLLNLMFRFYDPTSGAIKIDGQDIRQAAIKDLRDQMALVSQEIVLFDLTVEGNIACGKPGATREEIVAAARAAYAHEFVMQLPQGYDTPIGERGITLSGGQRQRLAIARAFVRNAPILVLDEATASLDSQAEAEVQEAIERLEQNRTVICVAHRLSTLRSCDRIIVLSAGRIVETGTFQGLLNSGGLFASMAARQKMQGNV